MAITTLHNATNRASMYNRLARRNGVIKFLRIGVPALGALVLAVLIVQIVIANIAQEYGVSGIILERDALIIETPKYAGTMSNGTEYSVTADKATALLTNTNVLDLTNAVLDLTRPDGMTLHAIAALAQYDLLAQTVKVAETMFVEDSRATQAILQNVMIDWTTQILTAQSGADVTFSDGTTLRGDTLTFNGITTDWTFTNAHLISTSSPNDLAGTSDTASDTTEAAQ